MAKLLPSDSLPPKELAIFKKIAKHYDQKQYKGGLKYVKQILSNPKFSEHGETLALKGILLNGLGKREEARDCVKRGLKANVRSFLCWHAYGLIQKSDHNYDQAIKCYLQALKLDPENIQVLRDIYVLQMQLRDYEGCKTTRYNLLTLRPSQRPSWLGYAVVHHLMGNFETALTVLNEIRKGQTDTTVNYENSEVILYQAMIMMEASMGERALDHLVQHSDDIVDKAALLDVKTNLLLSLNRNDEAKKECWKLIARNPEDKTYIKLLCRCFGSESDNQTQCVAINAILERHPKARLPKRLRLELLTGNEFLNELDIYLQQAIRKGVPPLFKHLEGLWCDSTKLEALINLLSTYANNMENHVRLVEAGTDSEPEPPSTMVWLNYLIAHLLSYKHMYKEAIDLIDVQLSETPTLVDHYILKAEVFCSAGDFISASRWMEEAQSLDTADRYINARCTKLMVQANRIDDSVAMASKFTSRTLDYLSEMQCMWYFIERAKTHYASGDVNGALKCCNELDKQFTVIIEDQLDFHSYCLRKETLRAYIEMLRVEDHMHNHPSYYHAAHMAIKIYLKLYANPLSKSEEEANGLGDEQVDAETRKARNKQRKAARRAEAEAQRKTAEQTRRDQAQRSARGKQADEDAPGPQDKQTFSNSTFTVDHISSSEALENASRFLRPLWELSRSRTETYCLAYEVFERKGKMLLMLRAISRGCALESSCDHAWFHECCVRFLLLVDVFLANPASDSLLCQVLLERLPHVFESWSREAPQYRPSTFNSAFLARNKESYFHVFRGTFAQCFIHPDQKLKILSALPLPTSWSRHGVTWQDCSECLDLLQSAFMHSAIGSVDVKCIERYRVACSTAFPMANIFLTQQQQEELRLAATEAAAETAVRGVTLDSSSIEDSVAVDRTSTTKLCSLLAATKLNLVNGGDAPVCAAALN